MEMFVQYIWVVTFGVLYQVKTLIVSQARWIQKLCLEVDGLGCVEFDPMYFTFQLHWDPLTNQYDNIKLKSGHYSLERPENYFSKPKSSPVTSCM